MKPIAVLDAPTNLGLRPPVAGSVPGCAKAPGALRDAGLLGRLGARDAGYLVPPRYDRGTWQEGDGDFHAAEIAEYSRRLADRIDALHDSGEFPMVLGGDCTILFGAGIALRRRDGRFGLAYVDGHSDFRHPGNTAIAGPVGAAAGEGMAIVTGRGALDLGRLFDDPDAVVLGIRDNDDGIPELEQHGIPHRTAPRISAAGPAATANWALEPLGALDGFWLHLDVDVLDPSVMPAVDGPDPGGLAVGELTELLSGLVAAPGCLGIGVAIYDPGRDPTGEHAATIVDVLASAFKNG